MKRTALFGMLALFLAATSCSKSEEIEKAVAPTSIVVNTETVVFGDLVTAFKGNTWIDDAIRPADTDEVVYIDMTATPKMGCRGAKPCHKVLDEAAATYVAQANACCCTVIVGLQCCDRGTQINGLFAFVPDDPACN